jgi:predicted phage terminase large subunit-like protein
VLRQEQAKAGTRVPYVPVWHTTPKPDRIRSLEAHFNNGQLCFREDWAKVYRELINQFRIFPDKNAHDDGPDAIECVVAGLQNVKKKISQFNAPQNISSSGIPLP